MPYRSGGERLGKAFCFRNTGAVGKGMSPVIRIESFPKRNAPHIAGVITAYTGIYGAAELLENLPAQFEVEPETLEDLKRQL